MCIHVILQSLNSAADIYECGFIGVLYEPITHTVTRPSVEDVRYSTITCPVPSFNNPG